MNNTGNNRNKPTSQADNKDKQGVDKAPGEEQAKKEQVTFNDLKGKKVDGDPSLESDKPMKQ